MTALADASCPPRPKPVATNGDSKTCTRHPVSAAFRLAARIVTAPLRAVQRLFRELAAWLTDWHQAPQPKPRRQRQEGEFPPIPEAAPLLWDTLAWQHHRANYNRSRGPARQHRPCPPPRRSRPLSPQPRA